MHANVAAARISLSFQKSHSIDRAVALSAFFRSNAPVAFSHATVRSQKGTRCRIATTTIGPSIDRLIYPSAGAAID